MAIKYNGRDLQKRIINGREVEKVMYNGVQIRPSSTPPVSDDYLYFQVQPQETCTLTFRKSGNPPSVEIEISYDKETWTDYAIGTDITITQLTNIYFRNKSETPTEFSTTYDGYQFGFSGDGDVYCGGDVTSLLCKNGTTTLTSDYCFSGLFRTMPIITPPKLPATTLTKGCYSEMFERCGLLTELPELPATTLTTGCYNAMFQGCTSLAILPQLPVIDLPSGCYEVMFAYCPNIKISETQTGEYQTPYRIPTSGTGTYHYTSATWMFSATGGTFTGTPSINTTYYTSNTVI